MKILIDLQGAQTSGSRHRGIGRYSLSFTEGVLRNRGDHDVHILLNLAAGDLGLRSAKFGSKTLFGGVSLGVKRLDRTPMLFFGFDELLMMKR